MFNDRGYNVFNEIKGADMNRALRAISSLLHHGFVPIGKNVWTNWNLTIRIDENGQAIKENN